MRPAIAPMFAAALITSGIAYADGCESSIDAEAARMRAAKDCAAAYKTFDACLRGSTADVQRGAVVRDICETGFMSKLKPDQMKAYREKLGACEKKYAKQSGTMYRSMEAACAAKAARDVWARNSGRK